MYKVKITSILVSVLIITVMGLSYKNANALGILDYKVCLFHGHEYAIALNGQQCPLNINNPPIGDPYSKGEPWATTLKYIIHSPECYETHPGNL